MHPYLSHATFVRKTHAKGYLKQLKEILNLIQAGTGCGVSDYYRYGLYQDGYVINGTASDYIGWKYATEFNLALNPRQVVYPAWDKLVFNTLASEFGIPIVSSKATYHVANRLPACAGVHLKTKEQIGNFLRDFEQYPIFGKPVLSQQGVGALYIQGYDRDSDSVLIKGAENMAVSELVEKITGSFEKRYHKPECGYFFQPILQQHQQLNEFNGWEGICGVRVIMLNEPGGGFLHKAIWKIAIKPNLIDNFSLGKYGNIIADIDVQSGVVRRAIDKFWPHTKNITHHPLSQAEIEGYQLPYWSQVIEICTAASKMLPLMKILHWDVVITDEGPVILELNDIGGLEIAQLNGEGMLVNKGRAFLKKYGDANKYPWIKNL